MSIPPFTSRTTMLSNPTQSPCVRNCCLNPQDVCLGCGRTLEEIRSWTSYTREQREQVLELAGERASALRKGPF